MRSGVQILERFKTLANEVFSFSIPDYLASKGNISLFGYETDRVKSVVAPLFGNPPFILTTAINSAKYVDAVAGYCVDVGKKFPVAKVNADVLLISKSLLSNDDDKFDAILTHEICHLLIDSSSIGKTSLVIDEKAKYHGASLFLKTDTERQHITRHTLLFCELLAAAAEKLAVIVPSLKDRKGAINAAMHFDLRANLPGFP